jgi:hypothetical protein
VVGSSPPHHHQQQQQQQQQHEQEEEKAPASPKGPLPWRVVDTLVVDDKDQVGLAGEQAEGHGDVWQMT